MADIESEQEEIRKVCYNLNQAIFYWYIDFYMKMQFLCSHCLYLAAM